MRTKFEFDFVTTATPDQVIELMTNFSPNRPHRWPASSVKAFEVYRLGETEADIREGQDFPKVWATWHYDWSTPRNGHPDRCGERRDGGVRLYDPDGDADRRGRQFGARGGNRPRGTSRGSWG